MECFENRDQLNPLIEKIYSYEYIKSLKGDKQYGKYVQTIQGYGSFPCKNYKKEIIDWPIVALAGQKNYISVYVCALENGEYLAERYKEKLGNVSVGKSCIRFKRLEDVNLSELKKVLKKAVKTPGLVGADDYRKNQ